MHHLYFLLLYIQVVDYVNSQTPVSSTAILQPVTLTSATLTFMRSEVTTVVEKLLYFGVGGRVEDERAATALRLTGFQEQTIKRLMTHLPDVKDAETGQCN